MNYQIQLSREAEKRLDRMDRVTYERIERRIDELGTNPYNSRIAKPLKGLEGLHSSRVGDWRIIYTVNREDRTIYIVAVRPRSEAYRQL